MQMVVQEHPSQEFYACLLLFAHSLLLSGLENPTVVCASPHSMPTARADFQHHCIMRMNICHLGDAVNSEQVVPSPHTTALSGRKLLHCLPGITYIHEGYGLIPCGAATGMGGRAVMSLCYDGTLPQQAAQRQVIICTVTMAGPAAVLEHHNLI